MTTHNDLIPILKKLRLSGVLESFDLRSREAAEDNLSHAEFTLRLLSDEIASRCDDVSGRGPFGPAGATA